MTVHRRDYGAVYFVKPRFPLGVFLRDLNDSERQELQSNKGATVRLVVDGTPAFDADILVGDVITAIDGVPVSAHKDVGGLLRQRDGKQVLLSIVRRGQRIEKSVRLNHR
jgi:S1-C subfamily serine protease